MPRSKSTTRKQLQTSIICKKNNPVSSLESGSETSSKNSATEALLSEKAASSDQESVTLPAACYTGFPSAPIFDEMVNLSISMVQSLSGAQGVDTSVSFPCSTSSSSSSIVTNTASIDTISRYLLHPTEFRDLLKAFRSPPKKSHKKISPTERRTSRNSLRRRSSPRRLSAGSFSSSRLSFPFTLESLDGIHVKSFDIQGSCKEQQAAVLTTAATIFTAASSALDSQIETGKHEFSHFECPNPFAVNRTLARTPIKPVMSVTEASSSEKDDNPHAPTSETQCVLDPPSTLIEESTMVAPKVGEEEEEIPMIEARLTSEHQSIEPFIFHENGSSRNNSGQLRRSSIDELRRQSGQTRRLPRGPLSGPVDKAMIDDEESQSTTDRPHTIVPRSSEMAFLKEEVLGICIFKKTNLFLELI